MDLIYTKGFMYTKTLYNITKGTTLAGEGPYVCYICSKTIAQNSHLNQHINEAHQTTGCQIEEADLILEVVDKRNNDLDIKIETDHHDDDSNYIQNNQISSHDPNGFNLMNHTHFKCSYGDESSLTKFEETEQLIQNTDSKRYKKWHDGIKPFLCDQ